MRTGTAFAATVLLASCLLANVFAGHRERHELVQGLALVSFPSVTVAAAEWQHAHESQDGPGRIALAGDPAITSCARHLPVQHFCAGPAV